MEKQPEEDLEVQEYSGASIPPPSPVSRSSSHLPRSTTDALPEDPDLANGKIQHSKTLTPIRDDYNPYRVPPNFFYSDLHQKCRRVLQLQAKFEEDNEALDDYCPCCNYPIEGDLFPMNCSIRKLNELGEGFPLYYDMIQYLSGMIIVAFFVSGIYCLVTNYQADSIHDYDENLEGHLILTGTLDLQAWLHVICMWLFLIGFNFLTIRHKRLKGELDVTSTTPSDYTVMLTNVPEISEQESLKEFLEINGRPDGIRCHVVKLNLVYRMSKLVEAKVKQEKLKEKFAMAEKKLTEELKPPVGCFNPAKLSVAEYQNRLHQVEDTIKQWIYIEAKCVIKYLDHPELKTNWDIFRHIFCPPRNDMTKNEFQGYKIETKRAPEPSDINWENLGVSATQVPKKIIFTRRTITWAATLITLGASLLAIFFSSNVKSLLRSIYGPSHVSISETIAYNVLSFLPSTIVVVINLLLTFIIKITSKWEKHETITNYNTSVAVKMTIAMFLNTAIVSFILHWGDFYSSQGLAAEIYNIMISNAVVQPLVYLVNFPFLLQKMYRAIARKKQDQCLMTQRQANRLFEGPALDMPSRYATVMKTYLLTLVYAPMMPLSYFFGIIAVVLQYWVDKYMLLRVHARPTRLSHELDEIMLQFIPFGAIVYACANWIFFSKFQDDLLIPGIVGVVSTTVYYFIPIRSLTKAWRLKKALGKPVNPSDLSETDKPYEDAAVDFVDDYDRLNPLTQEAGNEYWINLILKKKGPEEAERVKDALSGLGSKIILEQLKRKNQFSGNKGFATMLGAGILSRKVMPAPTSAEEEHQVVYVNTSMSQEPQKLFGMIRLGGRETAASGGGEDTGRSSARPLIGGFVS